jgi:hypothetical protein
MPSMIKKKNRSAPRKILAVRDKNSRVLLDYYSHRRTEFDQRFIGGFGQGHLLPHAPQAKSALYAIPAKPFFVRIYAKLIPRLWT